MTPELKTACEVVFQEHKASAQPIKWNSETFRGRISLGLSEMAKATLVRKSIIFSPNKSKKMMTLLNPAVAGAASVEEAEGMIANKTQVLVASMANDQPAYTPNNVSGFDIPHPAYSHRLLSINGESQIPVAGIRWYMKPLFYYVVWPLCAAVAGAAISFVIDFTYTKLFLDWK